MEAERFLTQIIIEFNRKSVTSGEAAELIEKFGRKFKGKGAAMHPDSTEPQLAAFFFLDIPDSDVAEDAVQKIRENRSVEAAYIKPAAELP